MLDTTQRRARLWARHHLGPDAPDMLAATRALVALHSSDPLTPHLAAWARVADYHPDALHDALQAGTLLRVHAMRRTLWVVPADEIPVFDGAAGRRIAARERTRLVGWASAERDDAEGWLASLERDALAAVHETPGVMTRTLTRTVPALATRITVGSGKWATQAPIGSRLLYVLAMEGKLVRTPPAGSWKSSQYGWAAAEPTETLDEVAAQRLLLHRYVARFGPVTLTDMRWWTGWTIAQTKRALAAIDAVQVTLEGDDTGWMLGDDDDPSPAPSGVALLPGLDPTPMGFKQRDWFLGPHAAELFDRNGNIGPSIWADGRIVGGWAIRDDGTVVTRLLEDADEQQVEARAAELTGWLAGTSATPRFRTPLERSLT